MKQTLLLLFFITFSIAASGQTSFSDGLKFDRISKKTQIKIFPNPVATELSVTKNAVVKSITIYDTIGKKVKFFEYEEGSSYYVGDLTKGIYLVQFSDAKNKVIATKRMKKQ